MRVFQLSEIKLSLLQTP